MLSVFYLLPPAAALLLAAPLTTIRPDNAAMMLISMPFYLGVAAAPGYIYCWASQVRAREVSARIRWWIRGSLMAALTAGIGGIGGALWMLLFLPPSALTVAAVLAMWITFELGAAPGRNAAT